MANRIFNFFGWGEKATEIRKKETKQFTMFELPPSRTSKDLEKLKRAIQSAESWTHPNRTDLYDIYLEQLDYDGHLTGVLNKRRLNILNKGVTFQNESGVNDQVIEFIDSPTFMKFLSDTLDTIFWGYSLFEFDYDNPGEFKYYLIPRKHVKPETKQVVREQRDSTGVTYISDGMDKYICDLGEEKDFGLLRTACFYSIIKRNLLGDWANYSELAGNNFQLIKYKGNDHLVKNATEQAMKGSNRQVTLPDGVDVEFVNQSSASQNVLFEGLHNTLNKEISKLILGQTMTTEDGSSRSQAEVHQTQQNEIFLADERFVLNFLNHKFREYLPNWGLPNDGYFQFMEKPDIIEQLVIDEKIKNLGYVFKPEYLKEKYNIDDD